MKFKDTKFAQTMKAAAHKTWDATKAFGRQIKEHSVRSAVILFAAHQLNQPMNAQLKDNDYLLSNINKSEVSIDTTKKLATNMNIGQIIFTDNNGTQQYTVFDLGQKAKVFGIDISLNLKSRISGNDYAKDFLGSSKPAGKTRTEVELSAGRELINNDEGKLRIEIGGNIANNPGAADSVLKNWTMGAFASLEGGSDGLMGKLMGGYETFGGMSGYSTAAQVTYNGQFGLISGEYMFGVKGVFNEIKMNGNYGFKLDQSRTPVFIAELTSNIGKSSYLKVNTEIGKFSQVYEAVLEKASWNIGLKYRGYNSLNSNERINYQEIKVTFSWKY